MTPGGDDASNTPAGIEIKSPLLTLQLGEDPLTPTSLPNRRTGEQRPCGTRHVFSLRPEARV